MVRISNRKSKFNMKTKKNETNLQILNILQKNARTPFTKIAEALNLSETAIRKKVRALENQGTIRKYTIEIDPKKIGFDVNVLIGIDTRPEHLVSVTEKLRNIKNIRSLYSSSGDHMLLIECWFSTQKELRGFVKHLHKIKGIKKVCPAIILERIK